MKRLIAWHRENLANMGRTLSGLIEERNDRVSSLNHRIDDLTRDYNKLKNQILVATAERRDGFDRDKFLVSRKRK